MKKKLLFLIHDLGPGGAEKVLVNLVNNMDPKQFDITVMALFGGGVNEQFLKPHIRLINCFRRTIRGNSHLMKLLTPRQLHKWLIKDRYDIEVSYLEGPSARIISGCPYEDTKLISWIHCTMHTAEELAVGFRSCQEAKKCFSRFDKMVFVAKTVRDAFLELCPVEKTAVLYNTNDSAAILQRAEEPVDVEFPEDQICLISMGKLVPVKSFDRLIHVHARLRADGYPVRCYILGEGELRPELERLAGELGVQDSVVFLGYQTNPYCYVANSDLYVCSSLSEGFSTAATEALIVGIPVCTVEVSGMKEMLEENDEYGIVTENSEEALYLGIKKLLDDPVLLAHYKKQAAIRGKDFSTENTVKAVEETLMEALS